jgi:hypothetical protein
MAAEKFFIKKILGEDAASPEAKDSPAMGAFIYNGSNARSKRVWVILAQLSLSSQSTIRYVVYTLLYLAEAPQAICEFSI